MLFNSNVFLQFLAAFLLLYFACRRHLVARNLLIVAASYLFYGWWDYRFLALLLFTSLVDYGVGRRLAVIHGKRERKVWLSLSIAANLGVLGFFKYCNFFVGSFVELLEKLGVHTAPHTWHIILPVGISFYTFQSMSYALDVYHRKLPATRSLLNFLAFVSFFPQLVAGPIERARNLLPQFERTLTISSTQLTEAIWLLIWGMFKKVVVADNLAPLVELVYQHPTDSGPLVVLGTIAFAFQIYADFSGYSDIARGLGKLLGFELRLNFRLPYHAVSLRDFWRRWHISLSTWLRDYLYLSLGGNRRGPGRTCFNLMLTMLLGGLWHGAAWNFVLWGAWHGLGLVLTRRWAVEDGKAASAAARCLSRIVTLSFVLYGWLLFRAGSFDRIVTLTGALGHGLCPPWIWSYGFSLGCFVAPVLAIQCWQARVNDMLAPAKCAPWLRGSLQGLLLLLTAAFWDRQATPFIYFQF